MTEVMTEIAVPARFRGKPWLTLVVVSLAVVMVGIDGSVVAVANPYIGRDLHASLSDLQWITNAYLLVIAVSLILGGKLGDRFGRRRVFLIGVCGFTLSSLAIGIVGTIDGVIVLRGFQGAFAALLLPNTIALMRVAYPPEELNRGLVCGSAPLRRQRPQVPLSVVCSWSTSLGRACSLSIFQWASAPSSSEHSC